MKRGLLATLALLWLCAPAGAATPVLAQIGTFSQPVFLTAPPGDTTRVFVVEQGGTVRLLVDGAPRERPFLDLSGRSRGRPERRRPSDVGRRPWLPRSLV